MQRLTIGIFEEMHQKLEAKAKTKNLTLSNYARNLLDIGLRVEESAEQNGASNGNHFSEIDALGELKPLWKNMLSWSLETKSLVRYFVQNLPEKNKENLLEQIESVKDKSLTYVNGLFKENI